MILNLVHASIYWMKCYSRFSTKAYLYTDIKIIKYCLDRQLKLEAPAFPYYHRTIQAKRDIKDRTELILWSFYLTTDCQ